MKKTLAIFIPAYNEEKNIKKLLMEILEQTKENFTLEKILVVSDASTDNTKKEALSLNNPIIEVVENNRRIGKWFGFTVAQKKLKSDIIISLDADIEIKQKDLLQHITNSLEHTDFSSPRILPKKPLTYLQKVFEIGSLYTKDIFESDKNHAFFLCHGRFIGFTKRCFGSIKWAPTIGTDAYTYLYCMINGFIFSYTSTGYINYILPNTLDDFSKQSARFSAIRQVLLKYFKKEDINTFIQLNKIYIYKFSVIYLFRYPIYFLSYLYFFIYIKLTVKPKINHLWEISKSTK